MGIDLVRTGGTSGGWQGSCGCGLSGDVRKTQEEEPRKGSNRKRKVEVTVLHEFHRDPVYGADLHRADMPCARRAGDTGLKLK